MKRGHIDLPAISAELQMICSQAAVALRNTVPQAQLMSLAGSQSASGRLSLLQVCYSNLSVVALPGTKETLEDTTSLCRSCQDALTAQRG